MRYYKRMLLMFLSISLAFVIIIECVFLFSVVRNTQKSYENNADAAARYFAEFTEQRLWVATQYTATLRVSEHTRAFLQKAEPIQYKRLMLYRFLNSLYGLIPVRQNYLAISTLDEDYVIRNDGTGSISAFLSRFSMTREQLDGIVGNFNKSYIAQTAFIRVEDADGRILYNMVRYEPAFLLNKPLYIFISMYEDQLFDMSAIHGDGFALFYQDELVASAGDYTPEQFIEINSGTIPDNLVARKLSSSVQDYHYIYAADKPSVFNFSILLTISVGLLALICVAYMTVLMTRRMYLPIRELLDVAEIKNPSDEFECIRKTIVSLTSDIETMTISMNQYDELIETAFFLDLLNSPLQKNNFSDAMRQFLPYSVQGPFVAVIIRYNQSSTPRPDFSQDMAYMLKQSIDRYLKPVMESCRYSRKIDTSFDHTALILAFDDLKTLSDSLNDALLQTESRHRLDFTAAIGSPVDRIDDISVSHRHAKYILDAADFWGHGGKVVSHEIADRSSRATVYFPLDMERAIYGALSQGKPEIWMDIVNTIIHTNQQERDPNLPQLSLMFAACVNRILDALQLDLADIWGEDANPYLEFRSALTFDALRNKAFEFFGILSERLISEQQKLNPPTLKKMLLFIDENYERDISLIDLADHLGMSKNYVSTLFKNSVGSNFKDYLNSTRYRKACHIMERHPGIKVKDVAVQVGCNSDILARLFMKYAGILPREYQERLKKENT